ncbi:DUF1127 domain-containing protein [Gammaproteobacteria bacterium]|nr:DUF1127 domain-containing protein [Gammaproteobacteria bacterium]
MKTLQFGIASIVDSNTGNGLPHTDGRIDYAVAEKNAQHIRSKTVTTLAQRIGKAITTAIRILREQREHKRNIQLLAGLNDHMLEDIGLSRGEVNAAQLGQIDLQQLMARQHEPSYGKRLQLRSVQTSNHNPVIDNASNEALYTGAKCA